MRELFYEESSIPLKSVREAKLYTVFKVMAIVCFAVAAFILTFAGTYVPYLMGLKADGQLDGIGLAFALVTYFGLVVVIAAAGVVFWLFKNRFNVSYDYSFVEDELRVSKVYNGKKRKFLKLFKADQILKLGKCSGESFERTCAGLSKKAIRFLTPNREPSEGKDFYYILFSSSLEKAVYIIEARQELIEYLIRAAGRQKWEAR